MDILLRRILEIYLNNCKEEESFRDLAVYFSYMLFVSFAIF